MRYRGYSCEEGNHKIGGLELHGNPAEITVVRDVLALEALARRAAIPPVEASHIDRARSVADEALAQHSEEDETLWVRLPEITSGELSEAIGRAAESYRGIAVLAESGALPDDSVAQELRHDLWASRIPSEEVA